MIYDEEFIESLPKDKNLAGKMICDTFRRFDDVTSVEPNIMRIDNFDDYADAFAALEEFIISYDISSEIDFGLPDLPENNGEAINEILNTFKKATTYFDQELAKDKYEASREKYKGLFDNIFTYRFTDGDLNRVQTLINELRELISKSTLFDEKHKRRLLMKLENLQKELHKKVSSLDHFWGLVGDAGVAIGKFGKDSKPFVDRIREIADIVWRTQAAAEELPTATKFPSLPSADEE